MRLLVSIAALAALSATALGEVKVGEIRTRAHQVSGTVYAKDEKTLIVKGFTYDGAGPDAFFWVGTQGSRPSSVGTILPHPFKGKFYEYEDQSAPILSGRFNGDQDIVLTLPDTMKVTDIKWFSVWCRAFSANFGDFAFPENLSLDAAAVPEPASEPEPKTEPEPETGYDEGKKEELPPPVLAPVDNDISNVHNHPRDDPDAYAESEPESEPETEPVTGWNSGAHISSCTSLMAVLIAAISWMVL